MKKTVQLEDVRRCRPIPASDKDAKKLDELILKLQLVYQPKSMPGVYVSARSNIGPLAFMLDTTKEVPEEAKEVLNNYKPKVVYDRLSSDYIGTVSQATLRTYDLLASYARLAEEIIEEADLKKTYTGRLSTLAYDASSLLDELTEEEINKSEEANFLINEDFFNLFNEIAPEDCHFGSNEGDGADFGFWPNWQELTEEEVEELIS